MEGKENLANIYRQAPSAADRDGHAQLKANPPSAETHPHTFAWFTLVSMFDDSVRNTWAAAGAAKAAPQKAAPAKKEAPKEAPVAPVEAAKKADDDEMDLFGDDEPDEVSLLFNRSLILIN